MGRAIWLSLPLAVGVLVLACGKRDTQATPETGTTFGTWREAVQRAHRAPPGPGVRYHLPAADCPSPAVDTLFLLASHRGSAVGARFVTTTGIPIAVPSDGDTLAALPASLVCGPTILGGASLQAIYLQAGADTVVYLGPAASVVLPYLYIRTRDGALGEAAWLGRSLVSYPDYQDSVRVARETARRAAVDSARAKAERREAERQARMTEARVREEHEQKREAAARAAAERERVGTIRAQGWPPHLTEAVIAREVTIGMTGAMVRLAWGRPRRVNTTITAAGKREQWVYGSGEYVYLEGGTVTAIQTSR